MFPTGWQYREYVDSNGTVERWHIHRVNDRAYNCKRITYPSIDAMERALAAAERSAEFIVTEPEASVDALRAEKEQSARFGTLYSAAAAVNFFAEGREQAASAAYDIVVAVDNQLTVDGSK